MNDNSNSSGPNELLDQNRLYPVTAGAHDKLIEGWPSDVRRPRNLDWVVVPISSAVLGDYADGGYQIVEVPHTPMAAIVEEGVVVRFVPLTDVPQLIEWFERMDYPN